MLVRSLIVRSLARQVPLRWMPRVSSAMRSRHLAAIANGNEHAFDSTLKEAIEAYESRDAERITTWERAFGTRVRQPSVE